MRKCLAICLIFLGFSVSAVKANTYDIAVSFPGTVEFFSIQKKGMDAAARAHDVKLIYADAEWDPGKQFSQIENFIARGVDAILLCPSDGQALRPVAQMAAEAKIPLITFTNPLGADPEGQYPGVVTFIGNNEVKLGKMLGDMAEQLLGDQPAKIVLIEGTPGTPPQRMRSKGFRDVVATHPNWEIVYSQGVTGWTKEGALAVMEAVLQTGKEFNLVATQWHAAASATVVALEEAQVERPIFVTSLELSKALVPAIQQGKVHATTNYSIYDAGVLTIDTAVKYLEGHKVPNFIELNTIVVDKNNVDSVPAEL
ncbi:sugar ABC transporter substrate-binding protein [Thaumasiovibrio subtropicus]|uniref:sugar ABC transporter substrate-binding protein n=1 Tax=Thaumasiovibrio subtropicus TaxID=1891207 RepID=UPI000B364497|nr:sugar ABC transporter substrate-binding protein [Thaumasiovibrio subtropicus]